MQFRQPLRPSSLSRTRIPNSPALRKDHEARGFIKSFQARKRPLRSRFPSFGTRIALTRPSQPLGRARLSATTAGCTHVRHFATNTFQELPAEAKIEEELVLGYRQEDFYPVELGEVFNARYQVVAKLGCGVGSTAWLC